MPASELLRTQHRVHQVHECRSAQEQRQQRHDNTYTRSQNSTKPSIAAKLTNPRTIMHNASIARLPGTSFEPDAPRNRRCNRNGEHEKSERHEFRLGPAA
jgi:hypothetical protein